MEHYDLIVVGAGPAGLALVKELADSNLKILLLDKKKNAGDVQYNTSGSFINPAEWDLPSDILNPISEIYFGSKNEKAIKKIRACIIDRKKLLVFLEKKAGKNKNLKIEYSAFVNAVSVKAVRINSLVYSKNNTDIKVTARLYADCSGTGNVLAGKVKLAPQKPIVGVGVEYIVALKSEPKTADLFVGSSLKGGYGWIFPKGGEKAIIGYATLLKENFSDIEKYLKDMWNIKRVADRCGQEPLEKNVAVLRTGKPLEKFSHENLLMIGDVALQANPLVGEGIRFVIDSAKIAAKCVLKTFSENREEALEDYSKEWKNKYYEKYKLAYVLQQKIKNDSSDDRKMDLGIRKIKYISDADFAKLLSGDFPKILLAKIILRSFLRF